jgi:hypothetical protein
MRFDQHEMRDAGWMILDHEYITDWDEIEEGC